MPESEFQMEYLGEKKLKRVKSLQTGREYLFQKRGTSKKKICILDPRDFAHYSQQRFRKTLKPVH